MNLSKTIKVDNKIQYYREYLKVLNVLLPEKLTDKEISVLSYILSQGRIKIPFNTAIRASIRQELGISSSSLSTHIKKLLKKAVIESDEYGVIIPKDFLYLDDDKLALTINIEYAT